MNGAPLLEQFTDQADSNARSAAYDPATSKLYTAGATGLFESTFSAGGVPTTTAIVAATSIGDVQIINGVVFYTSGAPRSSRSAARPTTATTGSNRRQRRQQDQPEPVLRSAWEPGAHLWHDRRRHALRHRYQGHQRNALQIHLERHGLGHRRHDHRPRHGHGQSDSGRNRAPSAARRPRSTSPKGIPAPATVGDVYAHSPMLLPRRFRMPLRRRRGSSTSRRSKTSCGVVLDAPDDGVGGIGGLGSVTAGYTLDASRRCKLGSGRDVYRRLEFHGAES